MRQRTPLTQLPATKFARNVSQRPTKRRQWLLDTSAEHSTELLAEYNRRQNHTTKQSQSSSTSDCRGESQRQLYERSCMLKEDIAGKLIKRVELISERQQIELAVQAEVYGETHRSSMKLVQCSTRTAKLKEDLFEYGFLKRRLQERIQTLEVEVGEHQQLQEALDVKYRETANEQKQRQADSEYRLLEFADRHSLLKVVMQFLLEYRQAAASRRESIRVQFVRFQKSILSSNRAQQIERLTDELRNSYLRISKEYVQAYNSIEQARQRLRQLQEKSIEQIKSLQRQLLSVKVNEQIGYNELSEAKKDQQNCQQTNEQIVTGKAEAIFQHYCQEHATALGQLEQRYGAEFRKRLLDEARHKFYCIIRQQTTNTAQEATRLAARLKLLDEIVDYNTESVEKHLLPQLAKLNNSRRLSTVVKDVRPNDTLVEQQNHLPLEDRRDSAYEYVETDSKNFSKQLPKSLGKRSLDRKRLRMSVDDRLGRTKELFKLRKDSLRNEQRLLTEAIDIRTTEHSIGQKTIVIGGPTETGQLLTIIRQLQVQAAVWKKSYAVAPTFQLEGSLEKMGYAGRLLSLSNDLNMQFRVGKEPNYRSTNLKLSKVDQTIQLQRVRRLDKVRSGLCFTICLDRGVLDIVLKSEDEYLTWFNGLTSLLRNRSLLSKLKQRL